MVLCNVTKWFQGDTVYVDISQCNLTAKEVNTTSPKEEDEYDDGAMKFTIAVVMVYGIAAMGVLALGFFSSRKRNHDLIDKETGKFVKQFDEVKFTFDKKARVGAVTALLQSVHGAQGNEHKRQNAVSSLALLTLPLTNITEDSEQSSMNDDIVYIDEKATFSAGDDGEKSTISSILSNKINMDTDTSLSIEDLASLTEDLDKAYHEHQSNALNAKTRCDYTCIYDRTNDVYEIIEHREDKFNHGRDATISARHGAMNDSLNSDSASHVDHDNLTLDDDVFVTETYDDDNFDIDVCSYPPRDHSPDWVDISKEYFFTV